MIRMSCEVWLRNPDMYIREVVEVGHGDVSWSAGLVVKKRIDVWKFMDLYYGHQMPWRAMIINSDKTILLDRDHKESDPAAIWPTWEYGQSMETLMDMIRNPRPGVEGQEHRVVISRIPNVSTGLGKAFIRELSDIQEEYPDVLLHIHGLYGFKVMFGLQFRSVDFEARTPAAKDKIILPSGKAVSQASSTQQPHWVELMGMRPVELKIPRNRCMFNIKSALWAADHFKDAIRFRTRGFSHIDPDDPLQRAPNSKSIMVKRRPASPGDKWLCEMCNLQTVCKYFRTGGVCIVPDSEPVELARFFKTRDADTIIEGLGTLLATQTHRLEKAIKAEEDSGQLHAETRKIINDLFDRGVKLAKLVDPALAAAGAPRSLTQNNINFEGMTPQALMAAVTDEFVKKGIPRDQITPEMIMSIVEKPEELRQRAIDVASEEAAS